jgi:hypothetical protein
MRMRAIVGTFTNVKIRFIHNWHLQCSMGAMFYHNFTQYDLNFVVRRAILVAGLGGL